MYVDGRLNFFRRMLHGTVEVSGREPNVGSPYC